jgi:hypothetical protein
MHHYYSFLAILKNDMTFCRTIKEAAHTIDPLARMKTIVKYYVQTQFINPTLCQCRVPLTPIIGETYQREMPTGEKLYVE